MKWQRGYSISCGSRELSNIASHSPSEIVLNALKEYESSVGSPSYKFAFVTFSDVVTSYPKCGLNLVEFIEKNKLGEIAASGIRPNPAHPPDYDDEDSGNLIQVWIWTVDWDTVRQFCYQEPKEEKTA